MSYLDAWGIWELYVGDMEVCEGFKAKFSAITPLVAVAVLLRTAE